MAAITAAARKLFDRQRSQVAEQLQAALAKVSKADDDTEAKIDRILADLDFGGYEPFMDIAAAEMRMLYDDGAQQAAQQLGQALLGVSLDQVHERAVDYARDRSAELVGMKWVDGDLVPNPRAEYQIDESTREMLRHIVRDAMEEGRSNDFLADALADIYAFSDQRAETIARTETAKADVQGTLAGYRELGVRRKEWLVGAGCCEDCQTLEGAVVGLDDQFTAESGERADGAPLHPNCRCDVLPVLDDDEER